MVTAGTALPLGVSTKTLSLAGGGAGRHRLTKCATLSYTTWGLTPLSHLTPEKWRPREVRNSPSVTQQVDVRAGIGSSLRLAPKPLF